MQTIGTFQKLLVNSYEWKKKLFKCNEISVEDYDEDSILGYILGVDCEYPKRLHNFNNNLLFLQRLKNATSLFAIFTIKTTMSTHIRILN